MRDRKVNTNGMQGNPCSSLTSKYPSCQDTLGRNLEVSSLGLDSSQCCTKKANEDGSYG